MTSDPTVDFDDLEAALLWVSADGALENRAFISRASGSIYYASADGFVDQEIPQDIDDATQYWQVPHRNDLDLGRALVFRYVSEALPDDFDTVRGYFHRRGAYAQFKALLQRRAHLEHWHAYENAATHQALLRWAAECGFRVLGPSRPLAGA